MKNIWLKPGITSGTSHCSESALMQLGLSIYTTEWWQTSDFVCMNSQKHLPEQRLVIMTIK
jgi:hypothetical protein